jgi:GH24 family phage-related lysozyme (muramidase)
VADRGFDGTIWTRPQFQAHLDKITLPAWIRFLVLHSTSAPNLAQQRATTTGDADRDASQRMKNFWGRVLELGGRGWHLTIFENGKIGKGTDLRVQGIHAHSWNDESIGVELCMDGSSADVGTEAGKLMIETAAWVFSRLLKKLKLPADATTIKYHREEPRAKLNGKTCPGTKMFPKDDFIKLVKTYLEGDKPVHLPPEGLAPPVVAGIAMPPKQPWATKDVQAHLTRLGYDPGPIDDDYGSKTEMAVRAFQRAMGVFESGKVGQWLWDKMRALQAPVRPSEGTEKIYQPGSCMWSEEWCLPSMKKVEGLRLKAYFDRPGWAIGYGHNSTSKLAPVPYEGMVLKTEKEAEDILRIDLNECVRYINAWVKVPLTQGQVDALCMNIFQQGPSQFRKRLLPTINEMKHGVTASLIETMEHINPGVERRRRFEADRYRGNKPTRW